MYDPLSHKHCWLTHDRDGYGVRWWWENGMPCPEPDHPDHN